ncbi:unnamed protein product [Protopolystoma xenopodis]|uniref:Uncharacterized protein n=1 Tax=Protopolystoma xenopodis TaxID=117903 RepID=A0A3S5ADZ4_9PLAT|nr:unnamed protein product [Protopolystoma xenopodis]
MQIYAFLGDNDSTFGARIDVAKVDKGNCDEFAPKYEEQLLSLVLRPHEGRLVQQAAVAQTDELIASDLPTQLFQLRPKQLILAPGTQSCVYVSFAPKSLQENPSNSWIIGR